MDLVTLGKVRDSPALLLLAGKQKGSPDPFQYPEPWIPVLWGLLERSRGRGAVLPQLAQWLLLELV